MPVKDVPLIKNIGVLLQTMQECGPGFCKIIWVRLYYDSVPLLFCSYVDGFHVYRVDGRTMSAAIRRGSFELVDAAVYRLKKRP